VEATRKPLAKKQEHPINGNSEKRSIVRTEEFL